MSSLCSRLKSLSVATMRLRDDEAMKRRLRMNVLEREDRVVLVDTIGGNLARDDLAEQAASGRQPSSRALLRPADSISRRPLSARASVPPSMYSSSPPTGTPYAIRLARKPCLCASAATRCAVASPSTVTLVASTISAKRSALKRRSSNSSPSSAGPMPSIGDRCPISTK